jgi:hypothetical protein
MAVISRLPQNYLAWNEELDQSPPWTSVRIDPPTTGVASPDGGTGANTLHEDNTAGNTHYIQQGFTRMPGIVYCLSVYALAINRTWIRFLAFAGGLSAFVDIQNGVFGVTGGTILNSGIVTLPSNWFRAFIAARSAATAADQYTIRIAEANNDDVFNGLDQDSVSLWRPQLNMGFVPDDTFLTGEVART